MWIAVLGPLLAAIGAMIGTFDKSLFEELLRGGGEEVFKRFAADHPAFTASLALSLGAVFWALLAAPLLYPVFQAMILRWWISGLRFGDLSVGTRLRTGQVYGAYLRFVGWSLVFGTIGGIIVSICLVVIGFLIGDGASEGKEIAATAVGLVGYVVIALGYSILYQVKVKLGLWRIVVDTTDLTNTAPLENISSVGAPASSVGEGLADALNVGGI
jgi:hypothetical protein